MFKKTRFFFDSAHTGLKKWLIDLLKKTETGWFFGSERNKISRIRFAKLIEEKYVNFKKMKAHETNREVKYCFLFILSVVPGKEVSPEASLLTIRVRRRYEVYTTNFNFFGINLKKRIQKFIFSVFSFRLPKLVYSPNPF